MVGVLNPVSKRMQERAKAIRRVRRAEKVSLRSLLENVEEIEEDELKQGKPRIRQWIPFYGILVALDDAEQGKPSIMEREDHFFRYHASRMYHFAFAVGIAFGVAYVGDKIVDYVAKRW